MENWSAILNKYIPGWETHPDFKSTPQKVSKMYDEFFRNEDPQNSFTEIIEIEKSNQEIEISKIKAIGLCPHHLLPIEYEMNIRYIPDKLCLGLSRFSRLAKAVTSFPKLQERVTEEISQLIIKNLSPKGLKITINAHHGCIRHRGVCEDTPVTTYFTYGNIK